MKREPLRVEPAIHATMEVSPPEVTSRYRRSRSICHPQPLKEDQSSSSEPQRENASAGELLIFSPLPLATMPPQLEEGPTTSQPLQPSTLGFTETSGSAVFRSASTSGSLKEGTLTCRFGPPLHGTFSYSVYCLSLSW